MNPRTQTQPARTKGYARLSSPLVRDAGGTLKPVSWDEALDRAATGLRDAVKRHGPRTFGLFSCSKSTNEVNFTAQKFARVVIGSNNVDSCNRT
jgi:formate dehydrogenase major subunit